MGQKDTVTKDYMPMPKTQSHMYLLLELMKQKQRIGIQQKTVQLLKTKLIT